MSCTDGNGEHVDDLSRATEDGEGVQHLVGATENGQTFTMARNDLNTNEMTGPVYSADKRILFANLYEPGITYAITGPWRPQN